MMRRLRATTWARSLEFIRDRSALGWNLLFPILLVAGLAWIFSGPGQPVFKVAVLADEAPSAALHPFFGIPHIQFYRETDLAPAIAKVQRHRVDLLIDLRSVPARYWVNEESPKGDLVEKLLQGAGGTPAERESTRGARIRYSDWVLPGVLGMNMMWSCLFGIGYVIVRYRKSGYLKRLNATPLRAVEFILAQIVSRLTLVLLVTAIVYLGADLLLGVRMEGSYALLMGVTVLGAFAMTAMGLLVSARISSEELVGGLLNLLTWPMMVISGVFFSMDGSPRVLQVAADFFPLTHLVGAARSIMLDGAGLAELWYPFTCLAVMSVLFLVLGAALFRWTQDA